MGKITSLKTYGKNVPYSVRREEMKRLVASGEAKSLREAAKLAGCSHSMAHSYVYKDKELREDVKKIFEKMGMSDYQLAKKANTLLKSVKPLWNISEKKWDMFPDNETQRNMLMMIFKLKGSFPKETIDINQQATFQVIIKNKEDVIGEIVDVTTDV